MVTVRSSRPQVEEGREPNIRPQQGRDGVPSSRHQEEDDYQNRYVSDGKEETAHSGESASLRTVKQKSAGTPKGARAQGTLVRSSTRQKSNADSSKEATAILGTDAEEAMRSPSD